MARETQYIGEPAIVDGDLVKKGGDYQRVCGIDNAIAILIGTNSGYWGNLIEPTESQIPGGMEELDGEPITSKFLSRHAAKVELLLSPLIASGVAKSISVESYNTENDRTDWTATIILKDGSVYYYSTDKKST